MAARQGTIETFAQNQRGFASTLLGLLEVVELDVFDSRAGVYDFQGVLQLHTGFEGIAVGVFPNRSGSAEDRTVANTPSSQVVCRKE